jgi:sugar O-acyltransferase (sialic acid O-acetyltransferase NeuD family)
MPQCPTFNFEYSHRERRPMKIVLLGAANPETRRMILAVERSQPELQFIGFIDNDSGKKGTTFLGLPVFGGFESVGELLGQDAFFVNLITGSTRVRYETSRELARRGCRFTNFIHPSVDLTMVSIGVGNYLQESVIVQAEVTIGDNSSIHMGTLIGHETRIGNSVFIAHGCSLSGSVTVGDGTFMGTHAAVVPRVTIGKWATVGAGTVVIKDVPDYATVVGNPAKIIKVGEPAYADGAIF